MLPVPASRACPARAFSLSASASCAAVYILYAPAHSAKLPSRVLPAWYVTEVSQAMWGEGGGGG